MCLGHVILIVTHGDCRNEGRGEMGRGGGGERVGVITSTLLIVGEGQIAERQQEQQE